MQIIKIENLIHEIRIHEFEYFIVILIEVHFLVSDALVQQAVFVRCC